MRYIGYACIISALVVFLSCGIEDYPYIYPVSTGNIHNELNSRIRVFISTNNSGNEFFSSYMIFYRIYISDVDFQSPSVGNYGTINTTLYSDYLRVQPYIGNDSMGSSSVAALFSDMKYYQLALENESIDYILSGNNAVNPVFGKYLVIDFSHDTENQTIPYLTLGSGPRYNLFRFSGGAEYTPRPNRYFLDTPELRAEENINDSYTNGDVNDKPNVERRYTYVSMYIVASGLDPTTFIQLYSSPTHIGVLQLPVPN